MLRLLRKQKLSYREDLDEERRKCLSTLHHLVLGAYFKR